MSADSGTSELRVVEITGLTHDGRGVASEAGKKFFIAGALPGETVEYRRPRRRRRHTEGTIVRVLRASQARVEPGCEVFGICGGCTLQHLEHADQLRHKESVLLDELRRSGEVVPAEVAAPITGPQWHYRRRARLGVKYVTKKKRVLVGFRERLKPYITDMRRCPILSAEAQYLPAQLADLIVRLSIRAELPQVEVAIADNAVALVFRVLGRPSPADLLLLARFGTEHGYQMYLQPAGPASVAALREFCPDSAASRAPAPLSYCVDEGRIRLEFSPTDFIQINARINQRLVAHAIGSLAIRPGDRVLDLYCGIGNFSLPIARRAAAVLGVEGASELAGRARRNAELNGIENARFLAADLERLDGRENWLAERWDLVLLDPPRGGARSILPQLARLSPRRIVYVSCDPGTLARDAGSLVHDHGYRLQQAGIVDMFAHTGHVESIAVLEK